MKTRCEKRRSLQKFSRERLSQGRDVLKPSRNAFSLVELVVVILILGILAAVAAPKNTSAANNTSIVSTVHAARNINDVATLFYGQNGVWPADALPGVMPSDFQTFFRSTDFTSIPPIGGRWDWNGPGTTIPYFGISVIGPSSSTSLMSYFHQIDTQYDDGNLTTGRIRRHIQGSNTALCFIVQ